jgi:hypothetical protein
MRRDALIFERLVDRAQTMDDVIRNLHAGMVPTLTDDEMLNRILQFQM